MRKLVLLAIVFAICALPCGAEPHNSDITRGGRQNVTARGLALDLMHLIGNVIQAFQLYDRNRTEIERDFAQFDALRDSDDEAARLQAAVSLARQAWDTVGQAVALYKEADRNRHNPSSNATWREANRINAEASRQLKAAQRALGDTRAGQDRPRIQGGVSQTSAPDPIWQFITTSPMDNGVNDVMTGFWQGLGHATKPPAMRGNLNYNRGYLAGAVVNVGSRLVPIRATRGRPGEFEEPSVPRTRTTETVALPSRGRWTTQLADDLLGGSHGETHVPPPGATAQQARQFAAARGNQNNTVWASHEEGVQDLQNALNNLRTEIGNLRPGQSGKFYAPTAQVRSGWNSYNGGMPMQATFRQVEIVVQKTVDGRGLQLLHFMPVP